METPAQKLYPLHPSQNTLHVSELAAGGSLAVRESNIIGFTLTVREETYSSEAIADALEKAMNHFVRTNDTLRLRFVHSGAGWKQYIAPWEYTAIDRMAVTDEKTFAAYMNKTYVGRPYWKKECVWLGRIGLLPKNGAVLALRVSHFVFDGYSFSLAHRRIREAYSAYLRGEEPADKPAPSIAACLEGYTAYAASAQFKADSAYWKKAYTTLKKYSFPAGYPALRMESASVSRFITAEQRADIAAAASACGASIPFFFEAAVALTVHKLTGKVCFNLSTLSHGRLKYTEKQTVGNLMNTFPMFFRIEDGNLADWIGKSYMIYLENVGHGRFPAVRQIPYSWKEAFLHGMNFNHSWFLFSSMDFGKAKADTNFHLETNAREAQPNQMYGALLDVSDGKVEISLSYQKHKYKKEQADRFIDAYLDILLRMASNPNGTIRDMI